MGGEMLHLFSRSILNRFRQMRRFDLVAVRQICNRPRQFQNPMIRARCTGQKPNTELNRHAYGNALERQLGRWFTSGFMPALGGNDCAGEHAS